MSSGRVRTVVFRRIAVSIGAAIIATGGCRALHRQSGSPTGGRLPLRIVVMDPLSAQLACDCVAGYAQRDYGRLGGFMSAKLGRQTEIVHSEALSLLRAPILRQADLVVGKFSVVVSDAKRASLGVRPIAMLTGPDGEMTQAGLFVVKQGDAAQSIEDLAGRRIIFGPPDEDEKHAAAFATLEAFGAPVPRSAPSKPSCNAIALAVVENEFDAGVVSSYAMPLLEGCGTIDKGALRIVGQTDPVPFIGVFATARVSREDEGRIAAALRDASSGPDLLRAMESKGGFIRLPKIGEGAGWTDWRGPGRHALSDRVPTELPARRRLLWSHTMTGSGMSGLAATGQYVIAADKDIDDEEDVFRCLDADTGREVWRLAYPAAGNMDYTNSPRANPVVCGDLVYLLGAFGRLHCVRLGTGEVVWQRRLVEDFAAELPQWGYSSTPLVVGDKLIVNPGAKDASLAALDRFTGKTHWTTPGDPPGYASSVLAQLGGVRQVVGYDIVSLGGWDPDTGQRLWRLEPDVDGDFNVATPIVVGDRLLVSTENNGTRLYGFDREGRIEPAPLASNDDLAPGMSTPVAIDGLVFGCSGRLTCLDAGDGLKTLWEADEDPFGDYCTFIAGKGHVLVMTQGGVLCLLRASREGLKCVSRLSLFDDVPQTERDVWSHPALVGNRLYVRNLLAVYCFLIG